MTSTSELPGGIIGLDIGGSETRGVLWRAGEVIADEWLGSANVQNVSVAEARTHLAELFGKLPGDSSGRLSPGSVECVFAGSGGIDTEVDAEFLAALIRPYVVEASVTVVHDTRLVLSAGRVSIGIAVIAGTGSAAWGVNHEGGQVRADGWGYVLGDEGSGYWLGREAVRYSLHRMDLGQESDQLTAALLRAGRAEAAHRLFPRRHLSTLLGGLDRAVRPYRPRLRPGHAPAVAVAGLPRAVGSQRLYRCSGVGSGSHLRCLGPGPCPVVATWLPGPYLIHKRTSSPALGEKKGFILSGCCD